MNLNEINSAMDSLKGWSIQTDSITKDFTLPNFKGAMEFVNKVAEIADKLNHHPTIRINYNIVKITSTTHSEKGLTNKDFELAQEIDKLE